VSVLATILTRISVTWMMTDNPNNPHLHGLLGSGGVPGVQRPQPPQRNVQRAECAYREATTARQLLSSRTCGSREMRRTT
jgi:hypothetical protein